MDTEVKEMKKGQTMVGFFDPAGNQSLLELAKARQANVIAMEMVPAYLEGSKDGRAVVDGQYRRIPSGNRGR